MHIYCRDIVHIITLGAGALQLTANANNLAVLDGVEDLGCPRGPARRAKHTFQGHGLLLVVDGLAGTQQILYGILLFFFRSALRRARSRSRRVLQSMGLLRRS